MTKRPSLQRDPQWRWFSDSQKRRRPTLLNTVFLFFLIIIFLFVAPWALTQAFVDTQYRVFDKSVVRELNLNCKSYLPRVSRITVPEASIFSFDGGKKTQNRGRTSQ